MVSISFSTDASLAQYGASLIPKEFSLEAYKYVFSDTFGILSAYLNTIVVVAIGTVLSVFFTACLAYALSIRDLPGRKFFSAMLVFTMYFSGGIIPSYLMITRTLHLSNTLWAVILPSLISTWNVILMRNFFSELPPSLAESARLDGAGELRILLQIIIPVSKPIIATVVLFVAVAYWNNWWDAMMYIQDRSKDTLMVVMRRVLTSMTSRDFQTAGSTANVPTEAVKNALVVVTTAPILIVYPFLQKYFTKGIVMGSVKG